MPTLSILTALYAPTATYLDPTIEGVIAQTLPAGWDLEWVVQEDGTDSGLSAKFDAAPFVRYEANGRHMGLAYTRNLALSRAAGSVVQVLDQDDILLPGAMARMVEHFADPRVHWAIGQADDLMPDGQRVSWDSALPFGFLAPGAVNDHAIDHGGNWPVHCAGLTMRTSTLRAVGGWLGVPIDDDVAMFAALSEVSGGYNEEAVTWLYRHHAQQTHKSDEWVARSAEGRRIAVQRVTALRQAPLRIDQSATVTEPVSTLPQVGPLDPEKLRRQETAANAERNHRSEPSA
jgi:glycosyltransferase involved in cell wall biosynthesis